MADDVKAQSITGGVLRPSGQASAGRRLADKVRAFDTSDERVRALVERRMNWANLTTAQRNEWLLDAVTFLLANEAQVRLRT